MARDGAATDALALEPSLREEDVCARDFGGLDSDDSDDSDPDVDGVAAGARVGDMDGDEVEPTDIAFILPNPRGIGTGGRGAGAGAEDEDIMVAAAAIVVIVDMEADADAATAARAATTFRLGIGGDPFCCGWSAGEETAMALVGGEADTAEPGVPDAAFDCASVDLRGITGSARGIGGVGGV